MTEPENPPAFPTPPASFGPSGDMGFAEEGMTLRDWFAGQALAGLMASTEHGDDRAPSYAYFLADKMLALRAVGGGK